MALLTQKAILSTFEEMLEEMPFDKITVSALVRRCGVSSNTFYYHYQDIYDLLDVWMSTRLGMLQSSGAVHFYGIGHFLLRLCSGTNRRYAAFGGIDPVHCAVLPLLFYRLLPEIYLGEDADRCG